MSVATRVVSTFLFYFLCFLFATVQVAAAVGCSVYALKRKWVNDPQVTVAKSRRSGGTSVAYENVEEAEPFWSNFSGRSISIFGAAGNPILETARTAATVGEIVVTVPIANSEGEDDADEEEEDALAGLAVIESADDIPAADGEDSS